MVAVGTTVDDAGVIPNSEVPPINGVVTLSAKIALEMKMPTRPLSEAALRKLTGYSFPGNIRELRNLLERALPRLLGLDAG